MLHKFYLQCSALLINYFNVIFIVNDYRSYEEVDKYRTGKDITVMSSDRSPVPYPIQHFKEANFPDYVMQVIRYVKYFIDLI